MSVFVSTSVSNQEKKKLLLLTHAIEEDVLVDNLFLSSE